MGGSQLKQLKTSLKSSGLSRTSNPKDKKKQAKQRKDLSSNSLAHRTAKLEAIHDKFNLFDVRDEKKKFEVVTRRGEVEGGKKGVPGRARAAGIESRKKTLLPMLDARTHTSTFLDHRFGESSTNLTPEEKALERFTAERQSRLGKKAKFNLEDDDDAGFELTHGGRTLGFGDEEELESGGWGGLGVSEGANREPLLKRRKMGAEPEEEDEPERKKTHAEIMEEVVAKSKFHKAERKRIRSADDETRLGLDADLKDLRMILGGSARMPAPSKAADSAGSGAPSGRNEKPAESEEDEEDEDEEEEDEDDEEEGDSDEDDSDSEGSTYELNDEELEAALAASSAKSGVDRDLLRKLIGSAADRSPSPPPFASTSNAPAFDEEEDMERPPPAKQADDDDKDPYDNYVRMLALEPRAHATNRMKTPLELAQQAAEELKEREEKRLKRQRGERDDSSDEEGPDGKKDKKGKGKRVPQADDLDDDFLEEGFEGGLSDGENEDGLGKGLEGLKPDAESEEEEGEDEGEDEESESEGDEDEEEDEMDVGDLSAEDSDDEVVEGETEALVAPTRSTAAAPGAELPFTFPCPSTHAEFVRLLTSSNIKEEDTPLVVKRIRTLYHPGLAVGNKEKLQVFANVLLDHVIYLAASSSPSAYRTINSLLPPLLTLSHAYPLACAPHYVSKLRLMHKNFLRGLSKGPLDTSAKTWPGPAELTLLRMVGMVWSTSDLSHPVAAAAQLLIGEYLAQARVRTLSDLASGLFLCTLSAQYERDSKRLTPESTNFVVSALLLLLPTSLSSKSIPVNFPTPDFQQEHAKALKLRGSAKGEKGKIEIEVKDRLNLIEAIQTGKTTSGAEAEQLKSDLVKTALTLLTDARERYSGSDAFVELFQPAEVLLKAAKLQKLPTAVKDNVTMTLSALTKSLTFALQARKPLTLQHHRAIPIATYLPKFDEGFNPNRRFDPDTERAAQSKLKALYKKEKKGAVRELRKDNRFLAVEEAKRKKTDDAAYEKKITKIMGSLQDERAEEKAFEREKSRGKRRDKARRG